MKKFKFKKWRGFKLKSKIISGWHRGCGRRR
jgi:hypothetical protein